MKSVIGVIKKLRGRKAELRCEDAVPLPVMLLLEEEFSDLATG